MKSSKWLICLVVLTTLVGIFSLQTYSRAQDSNHVQIIRVNTQDHPKIEVLVSVMDSAGRPIPGITGDKFSAAEDGKTIELKSTDSITDESIPLGIVLVMDTSQSMADYPLRKAKEAADAFVEQVRDIDEIALVAFNSTVSELQPMTTDKSLIKARIDSLKSGGKTALYDALAQAVKTAQTSQAQRRAIVLLTDGSEFGGLSKTARDEAYQLADRAGIPVFTIGLGWGIDSDYLKEVASKTGGNYYESPSPDDLTKVYKQIGTLLRSLYVLTFDTTLPANGDTHRIKVDVKVGDQTISAESSARYPAPIPVVRLTGVDPNTPLDKPATVRASVVADNKLAGFEYQIDGKSAAKGDTAPKPLTINPMELTPGKHALVLSVTDDKSHVGQATLDFQVAPLPPEFTIDGLKAGETLTANRTVTLKVGASQTTVTTASFDVDGTSFGTADKAPYTATIDVLALTPGKHVLTAQLKNAGATGKQSVEFVVSPAPRQTATMGAAIVVTRNAAGTLTAMPTKTPIPTRTSTPKPTNTPLPVTSTPKPTNTTLPPTNTVAPPTSTSVPPTNTVVPTVNQTATAQAVALLATATYTPSTTPQLTNTVTNTPLPTATATAPATKTVAPTNTATASLTSTVAPSATVQPSATPAPSPTPAPPAGILSANPAVLICGVLLVLILIALMILSGARRGARR